MSMSVFSIIALEIRFFPILSCFENKSPNLLYFVKQIVFKYANERPIIFSTFQPDAAQLVRKLQSTYPVSSFTYLFIYYFEFDRKKFALLR